MGHCEIEAKKLATNKILALALVVLIAAIVSSAIVSVLRRIFHWQKKM